MVKITSMIHDMIYGKYSIMLKMNVMKRDMDTPMKHMCDTQQANKGKERGMIVLRLLVGLNKSKTCYEQLGY